MRLYCSVTLPACSLLSASSDKALLLFSAAVIVLFFYIIESRSSKCLLRKTTKAPERLVDIKASSEAKETFEPKPDAKKQKEQTILPH